MEISSKLFLLDENVSNEIHFTLEIFYYDLQLCKRRLYHALSLITINNIRTYVVCNDSF